MKKNWLCLSLASVIAGFFGYHLCSFIKHWHPLLFFGGVLCGAAICGLMLGIVMRVILTPLESSSRFMPAIVGGVGGSYIGIIASSINYSDPLLRWDSMLCLAALCGLILGIAMRVTFKLKKHRQQEENENA